MKRDDEPGGYWRPGCPYCGYGNDVHTCADTIPFVPHDGDYSLCMGCGFWGIFEAGSIRRPDDIELAGIALDPACMRALDIWAQVVQPRYQKPM